MFPCARKIHLWESQHDAARCCNGWIRLMVPFHYGEPGYDWYRVVGRGIWRCFLIPEENTAEIEKLLALLPPEMLSSTPTNPWLRTPQ